MIAFTSIFTNGDTLGQYVKHVKWAHRFFNLDTTQWCTPALKQVIAGVKKVTPQASPKPALKRREMKGMVKEALRQGEIEVAAIMAIARHFLMRVPSEAIPLEWAGSHSTVVLTDTQCSITLMRRKNRSKPTTLTRHCICAESGKLLCSVHWMLTLQGRPGNGGRVFGLSKHHLARKVKQLAGAIGVAESHRVGTHAFRRGMAQDMLDMGGSLPALLHAGDWSSSAYLKYLRTSQTDDIAVAQATIYLSESEDE